MANQKPRILIIGHDRDSAYALRNVFDNQPYELEIGLGIEVAKSVLLERIRRFSRQEIPRDGRDKEQNRDGEGNAESQPGRQPPRSFLPGNNGRLFNRGQLPQRV